MLKLILNNHMPATAEELGETLARMGWKKISGKSLTKVFSIHASGKDIALRISRKGDLGFANYAELCIHSPNPHFQKIAWHDFLADGSHVTLTEKLYPLPAAKKLPPSMQAEAKALKAISNYYAWDHLEGGHSYDENKLSTLFGNLQDASPQMHDSVVTLQQCMNFIYQSSIHYSTPEIDLGSSNIMVRKGNTGEPQSIVLADPFAYDSSNDERDMTNVMNHHKLRILFDIPPQRLLNDLRLVGP